MRSIERRFWDGDPDVGLFCRECGHSHNLGEYHMKHPEKLEDIMTSLSEKDRERAKVGIILTG